MDLTGNDNGDDAFGLVAAYRKVKHRKSSRILTTNRKNLAQTAEPILAIASQAYISGDNERAAECYREAIKEFPKSPDGYLGLADIYAKNDDKLDSLVLSIIGAKVSGNNINYWLESAKQSLDMRLFNICLFCVTRVIDSKQETLETLVESTQYKISSNVSLGKFKKAKECLIKYLPNILDMLSSPSSTASIHANPRMASATESTLMLAADDCLKLLHTLQQNPSLFEADGVYDFCEEMLVFVCAKLSNAFPARFVKSIVSEPFQKYLMHQYSNIESHGSNKLSEDDVDYWLRECLGLTCALEWEACARCVLFDNDPTSSDSKEVIVKHLEKISFAMAKVGTRISSVAEHIGHLSYSSSSSSSSSSSYHLADPRSVMIHACHTMAEICLNYFNGRLIESPALNIQTVLINAINQLSDCMESDDDSIMESIEYWTVCSICQVIGRCLRDSESIKAAVIVLRHLGNNFVVHEVRIISELIVSSPECLSENFVLTEFVRCLNCCVDKQESLPFYESLLTCFIAGASQVNEEAIISIVHQCYSHFRDCTNSPMDNVRDLGVVVLRECVLQLKLSMERIFESHKPDEWKCSRYPDYSHKIQTEYFGLLPEHVRFSLTSRLNRREKSRSDRRSKRKMQDEVQTEGEDEEDEEQVEDLEAVVDDGLDYDQTLTTITVEERERRKDEKRCFDKILPFIKNILILFSRCVWSNASMSDGIKTDVCDLFISTLAIVSIVSKENISESLSLVIQEKFPLDPVLFPLTSFKQILRSGLLSGKAMKDVFICLANESLRITKASAAKELAAFTRNMTNCMALDMSESDRTQLQRACLPLIVKEPRDPTSKKSGKDRDRKTVDEIRKDDFASIVFQLKRDGDITAASHWLHNLVYNNLPLGDNIHVINEAMSMLQDSESCDIFGMASTGEGGEEENNDDDDDVFELDDDHKSALFYLTTAMKSKSFRSLCRYSLNRYREVCVSFKLEPVLNLSLSSKLFLLNCLQLSQPQMELLTDIEALVVQEIVYNYSRFMTLTSSSSDVKSHWQFTAFEVALTIHDCKKSSSLFCEHCLTREAAFNFCLLLKSVGSLHLANSITREYL